MPRARKKIKNNPQKISGWKKAVKTKINVKKTDSGEKPVKPRTKKKVKKEDLLNVSQNWDKYKENCINRTNEEEVLDEHSYSEDIERDKKLMMWAGVCFFMVLILFFWIINIKNVFKINEVDNSNSQNQLNWQEITDEFGKTMDEIKNIKSEMDNYNKEETTPKDETLELSQEEMSELKERLKKLEEEFEVKN